MNFKLGTGLLIGALAIGATAAPHHQLTSPAFRDVAYFTQAITLDGTTSTSMNVAPLTSSSTGFGLGRLNTTFKDKAIGALSILPIARPSNQGDALVIANTWVVEKALPFKDAMSAWMRAHGVSAGVLNFTQEIEVNGALGPEKKQIAFNISMDASGRATYGNPKIVETNPTVLQVVYTPLASKQSLPSTWVYPDAGFLKWRVLSQKMEPITGWKLENVGGAYDEAASWNPGDPDAMVQCLMDSRGAGCPQVLDVNTLLSKMGSSVALVGYLRSIEPDYQPNSAGVETAQLGMWVNERIWDCNYYTNNGVFGFVLSLKGDQYLAQAGLDKVTYNLISRTTGQAISPTEAYSKKISAAELGGLDPEKVILSPAPSGPSFWLQTDSEKMANVKYVAPLSQPISPQAIIANITYPYGGSVTMTAYDSQTTDFVVSLPGTTTAAGWGLADSSVESVSFDLASVALQKMWLTDISSGGPMAVTVNAAAIALSPNISISPYLGAGTNTMVATHVGPAALRLRVQGMCNAPAPTGTVITPVAPIDTGGGGDSGGGGASAE